jgi:hypothetical protein
MYVEPHKLSLTRKQRRDGTGSTTAPPAVAKCSRVRLKANAAPVYSSAFSMACVTSGLSGFTGGSNLPMI